MGRYIYIYIFTQSMASQWYVTFVYCCPYSFSYIGRSWVWSDLQSCNLLICGRFQRNGG